ncbi:MAG: DUF192 domain-containing protein [Candidatus Omnitrophica bacterium]|nr:DUF192 domain-containing protein [Candidatus Omnitrophota bacterium]
MSGIKKTAIFAGVVLCAAILAYLFLPWRPVIIRKTWVIVETARTPQQRCRGLQGRSLLAANSGMLFFFEQEGYPQFWMKDTFLPLDIAFIDAGKRIVDIQEMIPLQTEVRYLPPAPAKYVLEMNAGWFKKNNISAGQKVYFW